MTQSIPILPGYLDVEQMQTFVWCKYCKKWHQHGVAEGHKTAHCGTRTLYTETGYIVEIAGPWSKAIERGQGRVTEREVQDALVADLMSQGVSCECYTHCSVGIADVVTSDAVYEVKRDWSYVLEAVGQVLAYSKALGGGREPVLVFPWIPQEHPMFDILKQLGIRVMTVRIKLQDERPTGSERPRLFGFSKWLFDQTGRLDPVGDLSRNAVRDETWPIAGDNFAAFFEYLESCNANNDASRALVDGWGEWRDEIGKGDIENDSVG